jgi:glycosyltransferase involved in cell wall biosynthesis
MNGISVIIAAYNSQMFIAEAIQSVLDQDYDGHLEIIISDDGSSDKTLEISESFGDKVTILKRERDCLSQGASSTRNRGLMAATKPYICFLDSDDFLLPDHLNRIASVLENNPNLGFAFCRILEIKEEKGLKLYKPWTQQHISKNDVLNPMVSRNQVVCTNSFIFRKIVFDKVGGFNETYSNGEDSDMWMRISEKYRGAFVDHYGAVYRKQHGNNQLTKNPKEIINNCHLAIINNAIQRYYQLGLNDSNRIFELKHLILHGKYNNVKLFYVLKYLCLICRYPIPFSKRIVPIINKIIRTKKTNDWYELPHFIRIKS